MPCHSSYDRDYFTTKDRGFDLADETNVLQAYHHELLNPVQFNHPLLSVNSEARHVARSWLERRQDIDSYLWQPDQSVIFGRRFDLDRDSLYINADDMSEFLNEPYECESASTMLDRILGFQPARVKCLAIPFVVLDKTNVPTLAAMLYYGQGEDFTGIQELQIVAGHPPTNQFLPGLEVNRRWEIDLAADEATLKKAYQTRIDDIANSNHLEPSLQDLQKNLKASIDNELAAKSPLKDLIIRPVLATRS